MYHQTGFTTKKAFGRTAAAEAVADEAALRVSDLPSVRSFVRLEGARTRGGTTRVRATATAVSVEAMVAVSSSDSILYSWDTILNSIYVRSRELPVTRYV